MAGGVAGGVFTLMLALLMVLLSAGAVCSGYFLCRSEKRAVFTLALVLLLGALGVNLGWITYAFVTIRSWYRHAPGIFTTYWVGNALVAVVAAGVLVRCWIRRAGAGKSG